MERSSKMSSTAKHALVVVIVALLAMFLGAAPAPVAGASSSNVLHLKPYTARVSASPAYPDTGVSELADGVKASGGFTDVAWSGYDSGSPSFTFDLGGGYDITGISIRALSDTASGICVPTSVEFSSSADGIFFTGRGAQDTGTLVSGTPDNGVFAFELDDLSLGDKNFVRVTVTRNQGYWFFTDEVEATGGPSSTADAPYALSETTDVSLTALLTPSLNVQDLKRKCRQMGVGNVNLYVAYEGKAYFDISGLGNTYGLQQAKTAYLKRAIRVLNRAGIKVTGAISSQLWGPSPPPEAAPMLQDDGHAANDLIDPQKSQDFMVTLVERLVEGYGVSGVFVGEPYYGNCDYHPIDTDPQRNTRYTDFYQAVGDTVKAVDSSKEHKVILPVHTWFYQFYGFGAGTVDHGIPDEIKDVTADAFMVDASSVYEGGNWADELDNFKVMVALAERLGANKKAGVQISLVGFGTAEPVPVSVILDQIRWARKYGISEIQVFDYKYLSLYSRRDLRKISRALKTVNTKSVDTSPRVTEWLSTGNMSEQIAWRDHIYWKIAEARNVAGNYMIKIALDCDG